MRSIFDPEAVESLSRRLRTLSPDRPGRWGRMSAPQMVCHVGDQLRCAVGDMPAAPRRTPFRNRALRMLFVHLLPWPRGVLPTAPEMQSTTPDEWRADVDRVEALLRRARDRGPAARWPDHPAFGPLSGREWGWIVYKHTDHHLRQFGA